MSWVLSRETPDMTEREKHRLSCTMRLRHANTTVCVCLHVFVWQKLLFSNIPALVEAMLTSCYRTEAKQLAAQQQTQPLHLVMTWLHPPTPWHLVRRHYSSSSGQHWWITLQVFLLLVSLSCDWCSGTSVCPAAGGFSHPSYPNQSDAFIRVWHQP